MFNILALGDIVGPAAIEYVCSNLWKIRKENSISLVVANAENASVGNGLTKEDARALLEGGVDVITSGNHIWKWKDIYAMLDDNDYILRPCNYPSTNPGKGYSVINADGVSVLVVNVQGNVFMESLACPFASVSSVLEKNKGKYDLAIMDIHAEATSEKIALAHYFDGKIAAVFGTHTHVQTADEQILKNGTGYITDLGMCGVQGEALGVKAESVIKRLTAKMPVKFELADGKITINGCIFGINAQKKRTELVKRLIF